MINFELKKIKRIKTQKKTANVKTICKIIIFTFHTSRYKIGIARRINGENTGRILCDGKINKL